LSDEAARYSPSVYYVYRPSDAALASVAELKRDRRAPGAWRLMSEGIVEGRDEVGLSLFFRGGAGLWVGSELDIDEARALFEHRVDRWVNATIN
jgi:homospermidine synthase